MPMERPTTTAATTKLQEEAISGGNAMRSLDDAISAIQSHPEAIGVSGIVGSAVERAKGQLNPNSVTDTTITDTRQKASLAFSRVAKGLRVDSGNMSRYELNKLEQAGDVLDWKEAPQTALKKLNNLQAVVIGQQLRNLKARNASVKDDLLRKIDPSEVLGLVSDGLLSKEDAIRWHSLKP